MKIEIEINESVFETEESSKIKDALEIVEKYALINNWDVKRNLKKARREILQKRVQKAMNIAQEQLECDLYTL